MRPCSNGFDVLEALAKMLKGVQLIHQLADACFIKGFEASAVIHIGCQNVHRFLRAL